MAHHKPRKYNPEVFSTVAGLVIWTIFEVTKRRAPAKRRTARKARTTRSPVARDNPNVEEFNGHPVGGEDTPATDDQQ